MKLFPRQENFLQFLDWELAGEREVTWVWVRGHAGHEQNERVDALANAEAMRAAHEASLEVSLDGSTPRRV